MDSIISNTREPMKLLKKLRELSQDLMVLAVLFAAAKSGMYDADDEINS